MNVLRKRVAQIEAALRNRGLVYFGTRGADAEALLPVANLESVVSLIAPLGAATVREVCLETETNERVDLEAYSIDRDQRPIVGELRRQLLAMFGRPSCVLPYRPCAFLSSAWFPRADRVRYLGLFHEKQACFEHKPWVESQLSAIGVPVLPWRYCADNEIDLIKEWVAAEPLVLRANRTDGGIGVRLVRCPEDLDGQWPEHADGFLAAAPHLVPSIPLNVNVCVFPDGAVTFHGPSLQLIGLEGLTRRRFGYCGNDFATIGSLDTKALDALEDIALTTGRWLHQNGYRGAFGVDALFYDGKVYLTEVNPRFQGSSRLSARLDTQLGRPDVYLEHMAAFLGLPASPQVPLRDLAASQPAMAHVVSHNVSSEPVFVHDPKSESRGTELRLLPASGVAVRPEAIAFEVVVSSPVTTDGMSLSSEIRKLVRKMAARLYPETPRSASRASALGARARMDRA